MIENSVSMVSELLCTGCAACYNSCRQDAISMKLNSEGFWQPYVNESLCIKCGVCISVCPAEEVLKKNDNAPSCYAVIAKDDVLRKKSSSGGVFGVLASFVQKKNGYVCGAAFTEGLRLEHVIVSPKDSFEPLMGSKYLQSFVGKCYDKIKILLQQGRWVLFCGTPCQVAGLNKFLNKNYETLITADVMCHGGTSPMAFSKYISETFPNETVVDYHFREKTLVNWGYSENAYLKDGRVLRRLKGASSYLNMFRSCISVRNSCGTCKAASLPRQGDFTLADAWLIKTIDNSCDDGLGTSIISINNKNAEQIFSELKKDLKMVKEIPLDWVLTHGQPMGKPFKSTTFHHKRFFELLKTNTFERAARYTLSGRFDVAILGVWYGCNYGSLLTYYSLYNYIKQLGFLVLMVDKSPIVKNDPELNPAFHSRKFCIKHYADRISHPRMPERMHELSNVADTFILGSDQVLHRNCLEFPKNTYLMNFVDETKKKIIFSSSFGHEIDSNPPEKRLEIARLLRRFDHIGVREESGVQILKDNYGIYDATRVVDAIFLNNSEFYKTIATESNINESESFIAAYILDPNEDIKNALLYISKYLKMKLIVLLDGRTYLFDKNKKALGLNAVANLEVQDWIYYLYNANFIVTDSYHGTCFSVLFNKNFITFANKNRGLTRFKTILDMTGLNERIIFNPLDVMKNDYIFKSIDYTKINLKINFEIEKTKSWLNNALFSSKIIKNDAKWNIIVKNTTIDENHFISYFPDDNALCKFTSIIDYLKELSKNLYRYLVLVSVKDTPGKYINRSIDILLNDICVNGSLFNKHQYSFIAIIDGGLNVYEDINKNGISHYCGFIDGNHIDIDSKSHDKGNVSRIIINNINYSLNRRGLNFVVLDKSNNQVIDIVNFDTHTPQLYCCRVE